MPPTSVVDYRLAGGLPLLRPAEQAFEEMLLGWRNQQLARNLAFPTVNSREAESGRSTAGGEYPWLWTPQLVDDWLGEQRSARHLRQSTIRGKAITVRLFCEYLTDSVYGWPEECWGRFGVHPVQVCHEWNTAVHVQEAEGGRASCVPGRSCRRSSTARTSSSSSPGSGAAKAGCRLPRCNAVQGRLRLGVAPPGGCLLDTDDFGVNPHAPELGASGCSTCATARR